MRATVIAPEARRRETGRVMRYAFMGLPGPGDAVLEATRAAGIAPAVVVRSRPCDFEECGLPMVEASAGWEERVLGFRIEALVVANWERILPGGFLERLPLGGWNLHPSLLPRWRGHNPYFHALVHGDEETGVTVHRMTAAVDRGPILLQRRIPIGPEETLGSLWTRLGSLAAASWLEAYPHVSSGAPRVVEQPPGEWPEAPPVRAADLALHDRRSVAEAMRLVRAANPFYGAVAVLGGREVRIYEADAVESSHDRGAPSASAVRCRDGWILPKLVRCDGAEVMTGAELEARMKREHATPEANGQSG